MTNIIDLPVVTILDLPPEKIITRAEQESFENVLIIGWRDDGSFYFSSSAADDGDVLYLLELAKKKLMEIADA